MWILKSLPGVPGMKKTLPHGARAQPGLVRVQGTQQSQQRLRELPTISIKKSECYLQMLTGIVEDHEAWLFSQVLSDRSTSGTRHMLQHGHLPAGRKRLSP